MNLFIKTYPGLVPLLKQEIAYLVSEIPLVEEGNDWIVAQTTLDEGFFLLYHLHLILRGFFVLGKLTKGHEDLLPSFFARLPFTKKSFRFRLLGKKDLEERYGGKVLQALQREFKVKVDLENPDVLIGVEETPGGVFFGIEPFHHLAKREYRIYSSPGSIKAPLAFAMTFFSPEAKVIVDPFVKDGVVLIERALWHTSALRPQLHYHETLFGSVSFKEKQSLPAPKLYGFAEQFADLRKAKANAKLAQVHKMIMFSKTELSWLDYKFDKASIDLLVGLPPLVSKHHPLPQIQTLYHEFFYQSAYILQPRGKIVLWINERTHSLLQHYVHSFTSYPFQEFSLVVIEKNQVRNLENQEQEE